MISTTVNATVFTTSLPARPGVTKPSLDDRLDKVFRAAEHVDARCACMLNAAAHSRRVQGLQSRLHR